MGDLLGSIPPEKEFFLAIIVSVDPSRNGI